MYGLVFVLLGTAGVWAAPPVKGTGSTAPYDRRTAMQSYKRPQVIPFPKDNGYSKERAELGKMLFFDPRLSSSNEVSCASCHRPDYQWCDSRPRSQGVPKTDLPRRTPTVLNAAWADLLFWDGRASSLEEQALGPIQAAGEMNLPLDEMVAKVKAVPAYVALAAKAYPGEELTAKVVGKAIATFERTVVSGMAPFDEWIAGDENAISEPAKRGFDLFQTKAKCARCHGGWNFTDAAFHDLGMEGTDKGRGGVLANVPGVQHAFKTPTLRNVALRAPYGHDGSLKTLEDVIELYDKGPWVKRPSLAEEMVELKLTNEEKSDLIQFMKALSSVDEPIRKPEVP